MFILHKISWLIFSHFMLWLQLTCKYSGIIKYMYNLEQHAKENLREEALRTWSAALIADGAQGVWSAVSSDASFRRYFRLKTAQSSVIAVDSPPNKENNQAFLSIAEQWHKAGIGVPEVLFTDDKQGFMLLEDLGNMLFSQCLAEATDAKQRHALYTNALETLVHLQQHASTDLPMYDRSKLLEEMQLFTRWLCTAYMDINLAENLQQQFAQLFEMLADNALAQPQVAVHRDYHARNLMLQQQRIRIIDFQDAMCGPISYDVVSLLRDCYVRWDESETQSQLQTYYHLATKAGLNLPDMATFQQQFDFMGIQRHLKAAGIFARLYLRDAKMSYIDDVPNTCRYLQEICQRYPQTAWLANWLTDTFLPMLKHKKIQLS